MIFREHRGGLEESMGTQREVESLNELKDEFDLQDPIICKWYCYDDRIKWDTWIITDRNGVVGFSNGELKFNEQKI